jgi:hypothetical protein
MVMVVIGLAVVSVRQIGAQPVIGERVAIRAVVVIGHAGAHTAKRAFEGGRFKAGSPRGNNCIDLSQLLSGMPLFP